jgi:hypothetical protein
MVNPRFLLILGILNLPVYWCIWRALFGDWEDFKEAVYFWLTPRWLDWLRGELFEDTWANTKLLVFFVLCALFVASEYVMLLRHFPGIAGKASTTM